MAGGHFFILSFSSCERLRNSFSWKEFLDLLYGKDWCPFIKETFNGFGSALEYLGRYTHKITISNSRVLSVDEKQVVFSARSRIPGGARREITLPNTEFIRRYLTHVLPKGFQKIWYYGFVNNRGKTKNLRLIFTLQGHQRFRARYTNMTMAELLKAVWKIDLCVCPVCGAAGCTALGELMGFHKFLKNRRIFLRPF